MVQLDLVAVYIDDVILFSKTLGDQIKHLKEVVTRLHSHGLKLKPVKKGSGVLGALNSIICLELNPPKNLWL